MPDRNSVSKSSAGALGVVLLCAHCSGGTLGQQPTSERSPSDGSAGSNVPSDSGSGGAGGGGGATGGGGALVGAGGNEVGSAGAGNKGAGGPDGAPSDASTSVGDAAPGDSGNPSQDPCKGRIVCESFESTNPGSAPGKPWSVHSSKGSVMVDETRAVSGKRSLKVSIDATSSSDTYRQAMLAMSAAPLIPIPNNTLYGRFMVYTDRIPGSSVHWTFAHGDGPVQNNLVANYNLGGMGGLMANYYKNSSPTETDCWQTKDQMFPTGRWACVAFSFDGKNNEIRFWLDGQEVSELHVVGNDKTDATCTKKGIDGKWYAPDFKNISVGWESYQHDSAGAHTAWIDDVILDDEPIGCP